MNDTTKENSLKRTEFIYVCINATTKYAQKSMSNMKIILTTSFEILMPLNATTRRYLTFSAFEWFKNRNSFIMSLI